MSMSSEDEFAPLDKRPVAEARTVYRLVHVDRVDHPSLPQDFRSDRERNKTPVEREVAIPELTNGMSMFASLEQLCEIWVPVSDRAARRGRPVGIGEYIAAVELVPEQGVFIEDLEEPDGHLTVWGPAEQLAARVREVYAAAAACR